MRLILLLCIAAQSAMGGVVADTLWHECRGESFRGQVAVATVILNRSRRSGRSLSAVCLRRKQFSCWNKGYAPVITKTCAEAQLLHRFELMERDMRRGTFVPSGTWTHYYAQNVCHPYWADGLSNTVVIGNHTFGE